ncbi:hypothetical protein RRG08_030158 [Elysia crispata]|uniref:Uncharacterized protein n=1 Tax=Elysia crispata TaxID=231223 RepID=A0AAE1DKK7_9GAST|nr:hypothetical protein RRG08_030158 [Elysia crispata]
MSWMKCNSLTTVVFGEIFYVVLADSNQGIVQRLKCDRSFGAVERSVNGLRTLDSFLLSPCDGFIAGQVYYFDKARIQEWTCLPICVEDSESVFEDRASVLRAKAQKATLTQASLAPTWLGSIDFANPKTFYTAIRRGFLSLVSRSPPFSSVGVGVKKCLPASSTFLSGQY